MLLLVDENVPDSVSTFFRDGLIYAIGGVNLRWTTPLTTVETYDPASKTWSTRASLLTPRNHFGVTQGPEGRIYAISGQDSSGGPMATVESYDIATNVWRAQTNLPAGLDGLEATMGRNVGIYFVGGGTSSGTLTTN